MRLSLLLILIVAGVPPVWGEMYRWVDEYGKVHFSDKKPPAVQAENISDQVKQQNIDYSSGSAAKQLERYERIQSARDTEQQQRSSQRGDKDQERERNCRDAKRRLRVIRGPVVFYDEQGNPEQVTEKERERRAAALEQQIRQYCE